jgi:hypothetical protein
MRIIINMNQKSDKRFDAYSGGYEGNDNTARNIIQYFFATLQM